MQGSKTRFAMDEERIADPQVEAAAQLRRMRLAAGVSQEELARHIGISVRTIGRTERGDTIPHRRTVLRWVAFFNGVRR